MKPNLTRRSLVGSALLAISSQAFAHPWVDFLGQKDLDRSIFAILQQYLQLTEEDRPLMPAFIRRLQTKDLHTEDPETFKRWARGGKETQAELEAYVVEEFVVASNFFAVRAGEESRLRILPI